MRPPVAATSGTTHGRSRQHPRQSTTVTRSTAAARATAHRTSVQSLRQVTGGGARPTWPGTCGSGHWTGTTPIKFYAIIAPTSPMPQPPTVCSGAAASTTSPRPSGRPTATTTTRGSATSRRGSLRQDQFVIGGMNVA